MRKKFMTVSASIVDEGKSTGETINYVGRKISVERLVNMIRKEKKNQLLTLSNIVIGEKTYELSDDEFIKHAKEVSA